MPGLMFGGAYIWSKKIQTKVNLFARVHTWRAYIRGFIVLICNNEAVCITEH